MSCVYSKVKIVGTLLCVAGALAMSLMHSAGKNEAKFTSAQVDFVFDKEKIIGCLYLMAAVFVLSSNIVLQVCFVKARKIYCLLCSDSWRLIYSGNLGQAVTLGHFPAPMSLCAITSLIGAFTTAAVQLFEDHKLMFSLPLVSFGNLVGFSVLVSGNEFAPRIYYIASLPFFALVIFILH